MAAHERHGREALYGGLIIFAIVAFCFGIFFLDTFLAAIRDEDEIVAVLPEAPKLTVGSIVWIGGKPVGRVTRVAFMPFHGDSTARIAVGLEFPHEFHDQVRKDSHIRITSARIIGAPVVDITPGTAKAPVVTHGDTLFLAEIPTIPRLQVKVTAIAAAFDTATRELKALSGPANRRLASLAPVMRNMQVAQVQMASLMDAMQNGAAAGFMADTEFKTSLASLQKNAAALGPAMSKAQQNMTSAQGSIGPSLQRMQANAERLSLAIDHLQTLMKENNGTMYRMSADSALLKTLHGVKAQLDSLIIEAKKNPLKFVL